MSQNTQPFFPIGTIGIDWIHNPQLLLKCLTLQKQTDPVVSQMEKRTSRYFILISADTCF